ncbi:assimilatory nitrate reductase (NADH) beta subunit [Frankia casuarinae]|nr:assimilatory nitrate reductase (NADH) beta subunit [Frankia sp. CcI6]EYT93883.1 assimilatory nitrate reductase (NADH) beta subunit [Frankia casuarinae]KDA43408.1 assimilatory nitrate reductase (NADH) beta subunit [Frankia sp. BMG5.23]OAA23559.1 assimilatory nitrate reductase (NADH) beta subunit [Frankia casuarinae]
MTARPRTMMHDAAPASDSTGASGPRRVVIVGHGMAGSRMISELRSRDPNLIITVFGEEPHPAYNRILLSNVLAGKADLADITLVDHAASGDSGDGTPPRALVDVRAGVVAHHIDRTRRTVTADDGSVVAYDVLILATGSRAWLPPIEGLTRPDGTLLPGVAAFRTLDDCRHILTQSERATRAVVLGGGLLGLEAARGLVRRGLDTTVLHAAGHLMNRQLDRRAGQVLVRTLAGLGVRSRLEARVVRIHGDERLAGVELAGDEVLDADLLVVSTGVVAVTDLAAAAGLPVEAGIVVDDQMRSPADPAVFAVGDCAQHDGTVQGLVAPAWDQVRVVADVVTAADPAARYSGARPVTRLKASGVDLATMGEVDVDEFDEDAEVLQFVDVTRGTFKKLVIRGDRLVGAIMLGDNPTVGTVTQLFDRQAPVPADRRSLLFPTRTEVTVTDSPATLPDRVTICRCNNVTKGGITRCWLDGARDLPAIVTGTRATTGCGTCRDAVAGIVEWLAAADPDPSAAAGDNCAAGLEESPQTDRRSSGGCSATAEPRRYSSAGRPPPRGEVRWPSGTTNPGVDSTLRRKFGGSNATPHAAS